jgi:3-hydroxymyristoyl/3-hydroxydecanoyl-(acyl carrier protein) dehydratase
VVPGVVLLEEIMMEIRAWRPTARIQGFQAVKFLQPVAPDSRFSIALEFLDEGKVGFSCSAGQRLLNRGTVILQVSQAPA